MFCTPFVSVLDNVQGCSDGSDIPRLISSREVFQCSFTLLELSSDQLSWGYATSIFS